MFTSMHLVVQLCKCSICLPSSLLFDFSSYVKFCYPLDNIRVSIIHFGIFFFHFILPIGHIRQGCFPCRCDFKIKGCPNNFWNPICVIFPPFTKFSTLIHLLQHNLHASFWETHGPMFFALPIGPFSVSTCFFLYFHGGIGIVIIEFNALVTYMGNWAFVAPIIFLSNHCPILLEVIGVNFFGLLPI